MGIAHKLRIKCLLGVTAAVIVGLKRLLEQAFENRLLSIMRDCGMDTAFALTLCAAAPRVAEGYAHAMCL